MLFVLIAVVELLRYLLRIIWSCLVLYILPSKAESVFLRQRSYMSELLLRQQMGIVFVYGYSSSYGTRLYLVFLLDIPLI